MFFRVPSLDLASQHHFLDQIKSECTFRSKGTCSTIFGTAFSSSAFCRDTQSQCRHLVACTSDGRLLIWNLAPSKTENSICDSATADAVDYYQRAHVQKRKMTNGHCQHVEVIICRGVLYDVQFIQDKENDNKDLLLTCGDEGVFVFKWSDLLSQIENTSSVKVQPFAHLKPHPNSFSPMNPTEINKISYDASSKILYGAAGDTLGGYIWDIQTSQIIGNLGIGQGSCHTDYLLTIRSIHDSDLSGVGLLSNSHCVLTGGADGKVGIWSGKDQRLIDQIDFNAILGGSLASTPTFNQSCSSWVSCMDVHPGGNWAVIGGGMDGSNSFQLGGFMALLHLPTRSVSIYKETKETIHDVAYHSNGAGIISVGNDCTASFWNSMDVSQGRTSRSWLSSPASYTIGINRDNDMMAVGGFGCSIDCFSTCMTNTCTLQRRK